MKVESKANLEMKMQNQSENLSQQGSKNLEKVKVEIKEKVEI